MEKEGKLHPSWRRWASPASPHMTPPGASQIQEVAREGGGEGEELEELGDGDQLEHWLLLEQEGRHLPGWFPGGLQPAVVVEPLLVHRGGGGDVLELHKLLGEVKLVL